MVGALKELSMQVSKMDVHACGRRVQMEVWLEEKKKKRFGPMVWDGIELKKWPNIGLGIRLPLGPTWASKIGSIYIYKKGNKHELKINKIKRK